MLLFVHSRCVNKYVLIKKFIIHIMLIHKVRRKVIKDGTEGHRDRRNCKTKEILEVIVLPQVTPYSLFVSLEISCRTSLVLTQW
jgi:hypothetical protein